MPDNAFCSVDDFSYELPETLIAQNPAEKRDNSRLLVLPRFGGEFTHARFSDLPSFLCRGDLLVLNDTRVFKARLRGRKIPGGAAVEIFCLEPAGEDGEWRAMVRPGRKLRQGTSVRLADGTVVEIGRRIEGGLRVVRLPEGDGAALLFARCGELPLPPYITQSAADPERYQTVYGKIDNARSVAAPTAGLHFTPELLEGLRARGVGHEFISLDVGLGTFRPVKEQDVRDHRMHSERCRVGSSAVSRIAEARRAGGRIVAVGTTVVRTLESFADETGAISPGERETDIFIRPGYRFKVTDGLVTNFHLPRSTLLMLVCAFAGRERVLSAYAEAVREKYGFFSFGDAMLII